MAHASRAAAAALTPFYDADGVTLYHGDVLAVLQALDVAVDLVIADPPPRPRQALCRGRDLTPER